MLKMFFLFVLISFALSVKAQTVYITENGEVTFYSYAPVEDIKATSSQVNSIINTVTGEVAFMIPMRSFHFAKALMEEHFNEKYIESEKYPQATFKGTINEKVDFSIKGIFPLTATGKMNIHGKEKEIIEKGEIELTEDKIILNTEFNVAIADYNIKTPKLLFNNIADTINVKMKVIYVPYKKK